MPDDAPARIVSTAPLFRGFVSLDRVVIEVPWRGREVRIEREIHFHGHVAAILPVDPVRRTAVLIRQFRASPFLEGEDGWLWEIPAGLIEDGHSPDGTAGREAGEETGLALSSVEPLGIVWASPGIVRERIHLFWGCYDAPPPDRFGGLDHEGETIEVHELPLAGIARMVAAGEVTDAKTEIAVSRFLAARADLVAGPR